MSLLSAFNNARASLGAVSAQSALVSRNIANVDNPSATRKFAQLGTDGLGSIQILSVAQSKDQALFRSLLTATASQGEASVTQEALDRLRDVIGDVDAETSPVSKLSALKSALSQYAVSPDNLQAATAAVDAARDMATSLNDATKAVQTMRLDADGQLADAATTMNGLLKELETVNARVVAGTASKADVTDQVDRRDAIVTQLSGYVGVNVQIRGGNDLVLYTDSGVTLFDKTARPVEFTPTQAYDPSVSGSPFKIDGVSISGPSSPMPVKSGSVVGLLTIRDQTAVTFQGQLDALASALVDSFSETDQTGTDFPGTRYAGLFTDNGGADTVVSTIDTTGLAARIRVAARADDRLGGDPMRLRDGGIADPADPLDPLDVRSTVYNSSGGNAFTGRLNDLITSFSTTRDYDASLGVGTKGTMADFGAASIGWLENKRSKATDDASYSSVLLDQAQQTLSDRTGVNMDEEMTKLLDLEHSYQASSKLISTIGTMLDSLIQIA